MGLLVAGLSCSISLFAEENRVVAWGNNCCGQTEVPRAATNVLSIAAADGNHSLALRSDGTVIAWGDNSQGQCNVPSDLGATAIAAGQDHSLALKADGTVVAWGSYFVSGGGMIPAFVPAGLTDVTAIAAGFAHNLALKRDGTVLVWGSVFAAPAPDGLSNVVAVAAGAGENIALKSDGTILAWGAAGAPFYDPPAGLSNVVAISATYYNFAALKADGSIVLWGMDDYAQTTIPSSLTNNVALISAGSKFYVAAKSDGGLLAWGWNYSNQTNPPVLEERILDVSSGGGHSLAIVRTGPPEIVEQPTSQTVFTGKSVSFRVKAFGSSPLSYQWRFNGSAMARATNAALMLNGVGMTNGGNYDVVVSNSYGQAVSDVAHLTTVESAPVILSEPTNRVGYVGRPASFSLVADGSAPLRFQWRFSDTNIPGATNSTLVLNPVRTNGFGLYSVVVSNRFGSVQSAHARLSPGLVFAWGDNSAGQTNVPSDLDGVAALSGGASLSLALRSDGTVVAWGNNSETETIPYPWLTNVSAIAGRGHNYLVLLRDGRAKGLGPLDSNVVTKIGAIATGPDYSLFVDSNGVAFASGVPYYFPAPVEGATNLIAVAAGSYHGLGLRTDGSLLSWGNDFFGQVTLPTLEPGFVDIAAGDEFSLALRYDGTLFAWGNDYAGQTNVPPGATNIIAISAGRAHAMALRQDGRLFVWGATNSGQGLIPSEFTFVSAIGCGDAHNLALLGSGELRLTRQPRTQTVHAGRPAVLSVSASAAGPVYYQWQLNGSDIQGASNSWLLLTNIQPESAGTYTVIVTGTNSSVMSAPASMTVVPTPLIVEQPTNQLTYLGDMVNFSVKAEGASPLYYQWQFEGRKIAGATNSTLAFLPVLLREAGAYSVIVSNEFGTVVSSVAALDLSPVVSWGSDRSIPVEASNVVAISSFYNSSLSLTRDGRIVSWGANAPPVPSDLTNVIAISAGRNYGLALRANRTVAAWGSPDTPGTTNIPPGLSNIVAVSAGNAHCLALRGDGTVIGWGLAGVPAGLTNIVEIAAGANRSLALRGNGSVTAWGAWSGVPVPQRLTDAVAIDALSMGVGLRRDGTPVAWASTYTNIPPIFTNTIQIAAGLNHGVVLRENGTVGSWGDNTLDQTNLPWGLTNVVAISAGNTHSLALIAEDPAEFAPPQVTAHATTNGYAVSFPTRRGWRYHLEYKNSLTDEVWVMLPPIPGDGTIQIATDPKPNAQQRFYRVRQLQ
jgi:alpha-tubulin suppressor-like RCC1 family protein